MKLENLKDLYIHELKDLHSAEKQITKALPKMAKAAGSDELATAFREHLDQTHEHIWRLEKTLGSMVKACVVQNAKAWRDYSKRALR